MIRQSTVLACSGQGDATINGGISDRMVLTGTLMGGTG